MQKIELGKDGMGSTISFNYDPYQSKSILVQGITGSRKTSLMLELIKRFNRIEQRPQIIVISREQEEAILRKEIPFVLVGDEGEIPIDVKLAKQLGENTRKQNHDVMIFLTSLKTEKEQDEFLASFIDGLMMDGQQKFWKPLLFVIDEAQLFCNSSKSSKSRDAIVRLIELGRKRGIIGIFSSHQMKDFYVRARAECGNSIIGYLRNPIDREFACELLNVSRAESETINSFREEPKGRFYAEGSDITIPAKIFLLESTKYSNEERFSIPKLSLENIQRANALRESIRMEDNTSLETRLRFENQSLQAKVDELAQTQMTDDNMVKLRKEGFKVGYNKAIEVTAQQINEESENHKILGIIKHGKKAMVTSDGSWGKKLVIE